MSEIYIFIDDECLFCNKFAIFCLKNERDEKQKFYFSGLNSNLSHLLFKRLDYELDYKSVICFKNGKIFTKTEAIIEISKNLKFPFFILFSLKILPQFIRNSLYILFSKNRYFFGKNESCELIPLLYKSRFISDKNDESTKIYSLLISKFNI